MKMKKFFVILLAFCMVISITACSAGSSTSQKNDKPPLIGVSIFDYTNNFMGYVRYGIQNYSKGKAQLIITDAQNSQTKQNNDIDTMISKGVKALCINPVNQQSATTINLKAKAAGIPVIYFNRDPSTPDMMTYDKCWYVGLDPTKGATIQAQEIQQAWKADPSLDKNHDGVIEYGLIKGTPGNPDAETRTSTVTSVMSQLGLTTKQLELQAANFDTTKAKSLMETWIAKYGSQMELVICNNDAMAIGAIGALQDNGYNATSGDKYIPVIGMNSLPEAQPFIKSGAMLGDVLEDPYAQAVDVVKMAINGINGKDITEGTGYTLDYTKAVRIPDVAITKDNLDVAAKAYDNCHK
jgi:methyl-galactoside transport system substrate-binding protein